LLLEVGYWVWVQLRLWVLLPQRAWALRAH
jgi:hypothetical protein